MGQIKNIKLHIVTDIKKTSKTKNSPWLRRNTTSKRSRLFQPQKTSSISSSPKHNERHPQSYTNSTTSAEFVVFISGRSNSPNRITTTNSPRSSVTSLVWKTSTLSTRISSMSCTTKIITSLPSVRSTLPNISSTTCPRITPG